MAKKSKVEEKSEQTNNVLKTPVLLPNSDYVVGEVYYVHKSFFAWQIPKNGKDTSFTALHPVKLEPGQPIIILKQVKPEINIYDTQDLEILCQVGDMIYGLVTAYYNLRNIGPEPPGLPFISLEFHVKM
jgi:hypothetical protein